MINPVSVILSFAAILLLLAWFKPNAARAVFGVFFLLMAWGINLPVTLTDPNQFVEAGRHAYIPFYRWFFTHVLTWNPALFALGLIAFETALGLLILSHGRAAKLGLLLAALFCVAIAWIGKEGLMMPFVALAPLLLLRSEYPDAVWALLARRLRRPATA